jgi:DNA-binding MarR family transcriptional regulator
MNEQKRKPYWVYETTLQQNDRLILSKKMLQSKAFIKLTGSAKQILLELRIRLKLESYKPSKHSRKSSQQFFAGNNGKLVLSYISIHKQFGYSTATISKAIDRLVANGFIEVAELGNGAKRQSHKIALIKNWEKFGTPEFKPGMGKSDKPVNGGFKKRKNLKTTSETKAGITLETKAVQSQKQPKPP